jgi:hypothetical protein
MGRVRADGTRTFRLTPPLVFWWAWVVFAVVCLGDIAVQGRDRASLDAAIIIVTITGLVYACALRPRVVADDDGVTVLNPIRDHRVPWGAVKGIVVRDSVEVQCSRPDPKGDKTVHSWALYSPRRSRARSQIRNQMWGRGDRGRPQGYARMPSQAREVLQQVPAELMARELARLSQEARRRGGVDDAVAVRAVDGALATRWAWEAVAAILIPAIALILVVAVR